MEALLCTWDGSGFVPDRRHTKACDAAFVVGERYMVEAALPRNMAQHRAYFAEIRTIWMNLPESIAERHQTPEALRKFALVRAGYAYETMRVFDTHDDAVKAAAFVAALDEFSVVQVSDNVLRAWRPKSQSVDAMGAAEFRESKDAVITFLLRMVEATREQLQIGVAAA